MHHTITKYLGDGKTIEIPDPDYYNISGEFIKVRHKRTDITPKKNKRKRK